MPTRVKKFLRSNFETLLLYPPLLFLIFPQESGYFHANAIFWLYPFFFFWVLVSRPRHYSKTLRPYLAFWLLFLLSALLSTLNSASRGLSLIKVADYLSIFIYSLYFYFVVDTPKKLKVFASLLIATALFLIALSLYFHLGVDSPSIGGINLFYPSHGHNHLSDFLILVLPLSTLSLLSSRPGRPYYLNLALFTVFNLFLLFTLGRSALVVHSLTLALIIYRFRPKLPRLLPLGISFIAPLALLTAILVFAHTTSLTGKLSSEQIKADWLWRQTIKPLDQEPRFAFWNQALSAFKENPLFGRGPNTFRLSSLKYRNKPDNLSNFAHNLPLELLSEQGLVALVIFTGVLITSANYFRSHSISNFTPTQQALSLGLLGLTLLSFVDFTLNFLLLSTLFFSLIAILIGQSRSPRNLSLPRLPIIAATTILLVFASLYSVSHLLRLSAPSGLTQSGLAVKLFPLDPVIVESSLSQTNLSRPFLQRAVSSIDFWHASHPHLINSLLTALPPTHQQSSTSRLRQLARLDPLNRPIRSKLINKLRTSGDHSQALQQALLYLDASNQYLLDPDASFSPQDLRRVISKPPSLHSPATYDQLLDDFSTIDQGLLHRLYSKLFYSLGLESFRNDNVQAALAYWRLASQLSPQWSYYHLELSNLYAKIDQPALARQALANCLKYNLAQAHCRDHLADNGARPPLTPGSFAPDISAIPLN